MSHSLCKMEGTANVTLSLQHRGGRLKSCSTLFTKWEGRQMSHSLCKMEGTANVSLSLQHGGM